MLKNLFKKITPLVNQDAKIDSDEHKFYEPILKKYLSTKNYTQYKSSRSSIAGQGELKKVYFDPLFMINHTFAMLRANINRLIRKTWCTTKDPVMLKHHLNIYMMFHNLELV